MILSDRSNAKDGCRPVIARLCPGIPCSPSLGEGVANCTPPHPHFLTQTMILSDRSNAEGWLAPGSVRPQDGGEGKGPGTAAVLHCDPGAVTNRGRAEAGVQKGDKISSRLCVLIDRPPRVCLK